MTPLPRAVQTTAPREPPARAVRTRNGANRLFSFGDGPAAALRLVCVPYAGAGAAVFRDWRLRLNAGIEVWAYEPPGRGRRCEEPPAPDVASLAEDLLARMEPLLDAPLAIFGHSMGALVAYELERKLEALGTAARHLFVSGSMAPDHPMRLPEVTQLDDSEFATLLRELGTPSAVLDDPELGEIVLGATRTDLTAYQVYAPSAAAPLATPITALAGVSDRLISRAGLEAWRGHTSAAFRTRWFDGAHFFIDDARTAVTQVVNESLRGVCAPAASRRPAR